MAFNIEQMMNTAVDAALSTTSIPVPEGEYEAFIDKVALRTVKKKDGYETLTCDVSWQIVQPDVSEVTGRDKNFVRQNLWLDLTSEGSLDVSKGANVGLGKLREAVGQNKPGKPWSFSMLQGGMAKLLVTHRTTENGEIYAEVKSVKSLG